MVVVGLVGVVPGIVVVFGSGTDMAVPGVGLAGGSVHIKPGSSYAIGIKASNSAGIKFGNGCGIPFSINKIPFLKYKPVMSIGFIFSGIL